MTSVCAFIMSEAFILQTMDSPVAAASFGGVGWPSLARLLFVRRRGAAPLRIIGSELAGLPSSVTRCRR